MSLLPRVKNIKEKLAHHPNGRNAKYKKRLFNSFLKECKKTFPLFLKEKYKVLDIGGGWGHMLLALSQTKLLKEGFLIDPYFSHYQKEFLHIYGLNPDFFKSQNILSINKSFHDTPTIHSVDIIIKTYNPSVSWIDILNTYEPKYIITDKASLGEIKNQYQQQFSFNFYSSTNKPNDFDYIFLKKNHLNHISSNSFSHTK